MKVYRGPALSDFSADAHELVDQKDLSYLADWHSSTSIRLNISKEHDERQAVAHIQLNEKDILHLHESLMNGLIARSEKLDKMFEALTEIRSMVWAGLRGDSREAIEAIGNEVDRAIELIAE